jgi:hypothetical protein
VDIYLALPANPGFPACVESSSKRLPPHDQAAFMLLSDVFDKIVHIPLDGDNI